MASSLFTETPEISNDIITRQTYIWSVYEMNRKKPINNDEFENWRQTFPKELVQYMDQRVNNNFSLTYIQDVQACEDVVWNQPAQNHLEFFWDNNFRSALETLLFLPFTMDFFYLKRINSSITNELLMELTNRAPTVVSKARDCEHYFIWIITLSELLYYVYRSKDGEIDFQMHMSIHNEHSIINKMHVESDYEMFLQNFLYWHIRMRLTIKTIIGFYFNDDAKNLIRQKINFINTLPITHLVSDVAN